MTDRLLLRGSSTQPLLLETIRRSLALVSARARKKLAVLTLANIFAAGLDTVALLLLVPLLSFLGAGSIPSGWETKLEGVFGGAESEQVAAILALVAALLFVIRSIVSVALVWVQTGVLNHAEQGLGSRIIGAFAAAPWLTQQQVKPGEMIRTTPVATGLAIKGVIGAAIGIMADIAVFLAVFTALLVVSPVMALAAVGFLVVASLLYVRLSRSQVAASGELIQTTTAQMNNAVLDLTGGVTELVVRGSTAAFSSRFDEAYVRNNAALRTINVLGFGTRYYLEVVLMVGVALAVGLAVLLDGSRDALVPIGILLAGGVRVLPALSRVIFFANQIRSYEPAVTVVENELERLEGMLRKVAPVEQAGLSLSGGFAFNDVSFTYSSDSSEVLREISLSVAAGETLGVVGESGAGKSTFIHLLLGLLDPTGGEIAVDEHRLQRALGDWRSIIGFVPQEIYLIDDTVAANVAFGEPVDGSSEAALASALSLAMLDQVVAEFPAGSATVVGQRGVKLSGGQRQRLGLARALYRDPKVLLLDEATSALDNETERAITHALTTLHGQTTMVIVAHRLSTVRACDRILYLENGRAVGLAGFDELQRDCAGFARMVELAALRPDQTL